MKIEYRNFLLKVLPPVAAQPRDRGRLVERASAEIAERRAADAAYR